MRPILLVISFLVLLKNSIAQQNELKLYSRRYERLNVDEILKSPRLVTNYVDCLLNKKPCPPEGKALKRILPEALKTKCGRCWPNQKEGAIKVITALYYNYPQHYDALRKKWDPTGEYHRRFEEYLKDQNFNIINSNSPTAQESVIHQAETPQVFNRIDLDSSNTFSPVAQTNLHANNQNKPSNNYIPDTRYLPPVVTKGPLLSPTRIPQLPSRSTRPTQSTLRQSSSGLSTTTTFSINLQPRPILEMAAIDQRPTRQQFGSTTQRQTTRQPITRRTATTAIPIRTQTTTKVPRSPPNKQNEISNRFGEEENEISPTRRTPRPSSTSQIHHQFLPGFTTTTTYSYETNNPVLNIINRITRKVANTAEFIAGMFSPPRQEYSRNPRPRQRNSNNYSNNNNCYNNFGQNFFCILQETLFGTRQ